MKTAAEIRQALRKRAAAKPSLAAAALGLGRHLLKKKIADGSVPTNAVGNVPSDWLLRQLEIGCRESGRAA